jgi:hypothetical protein
MAPMPGSIKFEEAATMPTVFITVGFPAFLVMGLPYLFGIAGAYACTSKRE